MLNFKPTSFKVLDISTVHITKADAEFLERCSNYRDSPLRRSFEYPHLVYEYAEGMFVYAGGEEKPECKTLSPACLDILQWAWAHKYRFIRFDCDGDIYPDLPAFDWETGAVSTGADHLPDFKGAQ